MSLGSLVSFTFSSYFLKDDKAFHWTRPPKAQQKEYRVSFLE